MQNNFESNRDTVIQAFNDCEDFTCREGGVTQNRFAVMYLKGITSRDYISEAILRPLLRDDLSSFSGDFSGLLEAASLTSVGALSDAPDSIAKGEVFVLVESKNGVFAVLANAQLAPKRGIEEPSSDVTLRGPKAGFNEDAETNVALLRRYIRTPDLKLRRFTVGSVSSTKVILAYVNGRASTRLVDEISRRINECDVSVITDSANIAMLLDKSTNPLFPNCGSTEKADKAASKLMAGRVAIIVDGSPFVLTLPFLFIEGLQASDDYLHTPYYATFIRLLRLLAFLSAVFAPAILCTVINRYSDSIPEGFYGIIVDARENIPLSFFWEIFTVLLLFELLREVGVRMPRTVGDAVGIVGSILLGNTAVEAGLVSSIGVITVAFSAVCAFITPAYMYVIVLARIAILILAELLGVWGIIIGTVLIFSLMCMKKSFGVYYMTPFIPFDRQGMQDSIFSYPKKTLGRRERMGSHKE